MDFRVLIGTLLLTVISCASKEVVKSTVVINQAEFLASQEAREKKLSKLTGNLKVGFDVQGKKMSGRARLIAHLKGPIRLEIRDMMGRTQYIASLEDRNFFALYPSQKMAYVEKEEGFTYFSKMVGIDLSFRDLVLLSLGVLPAGHRTACSGFERDTETGLYFVECGPENSRWKIKFEPGQKILTEVEAPFGHLIYEESEAVEGTLFLSNHAEFKSRGSLEVDWSKIEFEKVPSLPPFELREDVKQIEVKK